MKSVPLAFMLLITIGLAGTAGQAASDTAPGEECAPGAESVPCLAAQGDRHAMYMMGRDAYERGRESGDMALALEWARNAASTGDRSGKKLLKMVYLQVGEGVHKDFVQAYVWLTAAIAEGNDYLVVWRDRLIAKMTPDQLDQAKKLTGE